MRRLKSIIWVLIAIVLIGLCCWSATIARIIALAAIIVLALLNIFLGPTIDTIKDNITEEINESDYES